MKQHVNCSPLTLQAIEVTNFFNLEAREQYLPENGLVLVTGTNGKGKSASTIEAVAWGIYGETVRRPTVHSVVRRGTDSTRVKITLGGSTEVVRQKTGTRTRLGILGHPEYETTTKAQAALEQLVGMDYATWRRTHVVTSRDVDTFATSTDAQRKQYVEAVLGLDVFEAAHALAKKARQEAARQVDLARGVQRLAEAELQAAQRHLASLQAIHPSLGVLPSLQDAQKRLSKAQGALAEHDGSLRELRGLLRAKASLVEGLAGGICPTCGQEVSAGEGLEAAVLEHLELEVQAQAADDDRPRLAQDYQAALVEYQRVQQLHSQAAISQRAQLEVANAHQQLHERGELLRLALVKVADVEKELALCEATERVLGSKGFRGSALGNALAAASQLATHYLQRLEPGNPDASVTIGSQSQNKTGQVEEKLSLEVEGYPAETYGGCSDGQRRRVDLAVTLALSTMAPSKGTLFLDECLDRLDRDGVRAALGFLSHLSEQRCVVLITHHDELIKTVERAAHVVC